MTVSQITRPAADEGTERRVVLKPGPKPVLRRDTGKLMAVTAADSGHGIVPMLTSFTADEGTASLTYVLRGVKRILGDTELLRATIAGPDGLSEPQKDDFLVFYSDRNPALPAVISSTFPHAFHALCSKHLEVSSCLY